MESSPTVPISAQLKFNINAITEHIVKRIPIPVRDFMSDPRLIVIRSSDVNTPGAEVDELRSGVEGGSIVTGVSQLGMQVEIRPGTVTKDARAENNRYKPIFSRIVALLPENNLVQFAVPGGSVGAGTMLRGPPCRSGSGCSWEASSGAYRYVILETWQLSPH